MVFLGHRPGYFEIVVYTEEMIADDALSSLKPEPKKIKVKRVLQCRLIIDPIQAKSIAKWLNEHIKQYEKSFGEIKLPSEKPQGAKKES